MIIHQPQIEVSDGELCLSARVETERTHPNLPERLWYRFPASYQDYVSTRSDSFLVSLLLLAMYLGEDLQVDGVVSPRLAGNMDEIQDIYLRMLPGLQRVKIGYHELQAAAFKRTGAATSAFSGGIDSLYTLYSHLPDAGEAKPGDLTHGIFIDGFDIFLHDGQVYPNVYNKFKRFYSQLGLQLLQVRTNAYSFFQFRVDWVHSHEPILAGIAMLFERVIDRFYKPGGLDLIDGKASRPSYYTLPLMCTEGLEVLIDYPELSRFEKLQQIIDWPVAHDNLRVCIHPNKTSDGSACYRCEKCLNTLIYLELLGVREKFSTFPHPLTLWLFIKFGLVSDGFSYYVHLNPKLYKQYHRWDLWLLFYLLYLPLEIKPTLRKLLIRWLSPEMLYRLERLVYRAHWSG